MIIKDNVGLNHLAKNSTPHPVANKVLMVDPEHFDVEYAINPHMLDASGKLQKVNRAKAREQWLQLKNNYRSLGFEVATLKAEPKLPDMVFCANTSFPFVSSKQEKKVIKVKMHSAKRSDEVDPVMKWFSGQGYKVIERQQTSDFEGNGDALIHEEWILGGHGFRTNLSAYEEISALTQLPVIALKLVSEHFYHLDTCLTILNKDTVAIVKEGFSAESLSLLSALYKNVLTISKEEGIKNFAGNAHCPDGKNVIIHKGATHFNSELRRNGFIVHEIDTSEFIKSGGSVFCLKMMYY